MVEIVSLSQMKLIENNANELGLSYEQMMENAGYSAFKSILQKVGFASRKCVIFCGSGNNGGDGFVLARYAFEAGADVSVVLVNGYPKSELAKINIEKIKGLSIPILSTELNEQNVFDILNCSDIVVDAIYGTGFYGKISEESKRIFRAINNSISAIFSLDVPSGIVCDSGEFDEDTIEADFTIAFDSIKPCHILPNSIKKCGNVEVVDIGISENARDGLYCRANIITENLVQNLLPKRNEMGHKGSFGRVINVAGSASYMGAAVLNAMGSASSGCGYVTLMSTKDVCKNVASYIPEVTYVATEEDENGCIKFPNLYIVNEVFQKAQAISIGSGIGKAKELTKFVNQLLELQETPLIIDADGINAFKENINIIAEKKCPIIITPHLGEMARLLGCSVEAVEKDRFHKAMALAVRFGIVVVLKGHNTIIATPNREIYINSMENSGLSKAGSGDLLTGIIAGLVAQGISIENAAIIGVYIHSEAASMCSKRLSKHSMQPSDIREDISKLFNKFENEENGTNEEN